MRFTTVSTPGTPRAIVTACCDFVLVFDPAGQLDHAVADRADVDGALGENRIVAERLEHALLERLVVVLGLELVFLDVLELVLVLVRRVRAAQRLVGAAARRDDGASTSVR